MKVHLTRDQRIRVLNTDDVYRVMQQILLRENKIGRNKEHFWIVCLSNLERIMLIELLSLGTENATLVDPTEVFSFALQKQAKKLIMVHNHPDEVVLLPQPPGPRPSHHQRKEIPQLREHPCPRKTRQEQEVCASVQGRSRAAEGKGQERGMAGGEKRGA